MEDISSIGTIAQTINQVCHDATNGKAVLMESKQKIALITNIVESIDHDMAVKNSVLLSEMLSIFENILKEASKIEHMNMAIFYLKGMHYQESFKQMIESLRFYVDSLNVAHSSKVTVTQKLNDLGDAWEDVEENKSIRSVLRKERKQREELQIMIRSRSMTVDNLRQIGLADSKSDVLDLLRQVVEERNNLSKARTKKARIEAQNLDQLIILLKEVRAEFDVDTGVLPPTPNVQIPTCPVTFEPMDDPVIVDGKECKCCISRNAFEAWVSQAKSNGNPPSCPLCGGALHSTKAQPNTYLADIISALSSTNKSREGEQSFDSGYPNNAQRLSSNKDALENPLKPQSHRTTATNQHGNQIEIGASERDEENPRDANPSDPLDGETWQKKNFMLAAFVLFGVVSIATFVAVYFAVSKQTPTQEELESTLSSFITNVPTSEVQGEALQWLAGNDKKVMSGLDSYGILERFVLAIFFITTDGNGWKNNLNWQSNKPVCDWFGVGCTNKQVVRLRLSENSLAGTVPSELGTLSALTQLVMRRNSLAGSIPSDIGRLNALETSRGLVLT